jgi:hypothetical protein
MKMTYLKFVVVLQTCDHVDTTMLLFTVSLAITYTQF